MRLHFEAVFKRVPEATTEFTWKFVVYLGSNLWIPRDHLYLGQNKLLLLLLLDKVNTLYVYFLILEECRVHLQSYAVTCVASQWFGFIKVNDQEIFRCFYDQPSSGGGTSYYRGTNTVILDAMSCATRDLRWFDTCALAGSQNDVPSYPGTTQDLINYFNGLSPGTVLLAVSCDEPFNKLSSALPVLKTAGADVSDIGLDGMFAFVLQKGFPGKTVLAKRQRSNQCPALGLNVSTTGSFVVDNFLDSLKFVRTVN